VAASGKPATNTKTVAFDLSPWQNQSTENGDVKIEVSCYNYSSLNTTVYPWYYNLNMSFLDFTIIYIVLYNM